MLASVWYQILSNLWCTHIFENIFIGSSNPPPEISWTTIWTTETALIKNNQNTYFHIIPLKPRTILHYFINPGHAKDTHFLIKQPFFLTPLDLMHTFSQVNLCLRGFHNILSCNFSSLRCKMCSRKSVKKSNLYLKRSSHFFPPLTMMH